MAFGRLCKTNVPLCCWMASCLCVLFSADHDEDTDDDVFWWLTGSVCDWNLMICYYWWDKTVKNACNLCCVCYLFFFYMETKVLRFSCEMHVGNIAQLFRWWSATFSLNTLSMVYNFLYSNTTASVAITIVQITSWKHAEYPYLFWLQVVQTKNFPNVSWEVNLWDTIKWVKE